MAEIPEALIKQMMKATGQSREEVESVIQKLLKEMAQGIPDFGDLQEDEDSDDQPRGFSENEYPAYLAAKKVVKYTLRVSLRGVSPAIWRKIECPSNISLRHLSELFIPLMGWEGYHLNQFRAGYDYFAPHYQRENEMLVMFGRAKNYNQEEYSIADVLKEKSKSIEWEYDFGDSWYHDVRLSSIEEYEDDEPEEIVFRGGKRACPPENCGGVWGYVELLEILAKRKAGKRLDSEEKEHLAWAGFDSNYDPDYLDLEECKEIVEDLNDL